MVVHRNAVGCGEGGEWREHCVLNSLSSCADKGQRFGKAKRFGYKRSAKSYANEEKGEDGPPSSKQPKEE